MAEANEQIGIARAAYFPTVMLNASVGFEGSSFGNVLNAWRLLWSVGASITQTIFDTGRRQAVWDAARAAYDLLDGGQDRLAIADHGGVGDNLAALLILEQEAEQQRRAVESNAAAQLVEPARPPEGMALGRDREEDMLHDLLGVGVVAADPSGEPARAPRIPLHDRLDGDGFSGGLA